MIEHNDDDRYNTAAGVGALVAALTILIGMVLAARALAGV